MNEIIAGHRFRDATPTVFGHPAPDWIVGQIFTGTDGVRYARVYSASNPRDQKTLSIAILRDKRRFALVGTISAE
jgi:hypothetical protein